MDPLQPIAALPQTTPDTTPGAAPKAVLATGPMAAPEMAPAAAPRNAPGSAPRTPKLASVAILKDPSKPPAPNAVSTAAATVTAGSKTPAKSAPKPAAKAAPGPETMVPGPGPAPGAPSSRQAPEPPGPGQAAEPPGPGQAAGDNAPPERPARRAEVEPVPLPVGATALTDLLPKKQYPPVESVANIELTKASMLAFIESVVGDAPHQGPPGHNQKLIRHVIDGYNDLLDQGINQIMTQLFNVNRMLRNERANTEADRSRKNFEIELQFHDVNVGRPTHPVYMTGQFSDLYPAQTRLTGVSYSGPVTLGATVSIRAHYADGHIEPKIAEIPQFQIGTFPVMVGSNRCHTHNATRAALKEMGEDPTDPGGYFIAKRGEHVIDLLENIRYNSVHIHQHMKTNEHLRAEFLSQPGGAFENSSQIRVRYMVNGQITIEINSTKFEKARLPFYILYRLFGMTSDLDITQTIVFDVNDKKPATKRMLEILAQAFRLSDDLFSPLITELHRETLVQQTAVRLAKYLTNPTAYTTNENAVQYLNSDLLRSLDKVILPHMGQTAAERLRKLRFLGLLIHKMFLVHFGTLPPTDRDSYRNKRVHGSGVSLAKAFKTQVNNNIVVPIMSAFRRELKNNPWESITDKTIIDTFRNSVATSDLNRAMEQAITAGNKTIVVRRRAATNRVSSQLLERKNGLNTISAERNIVTQNGGNQSKQTDRADKMRRVHGTYTGFVCVAQSADTGENVGMRKQMAITASVCMAGDALLLKMRLLGDPAVIDLDAVSSQDMARGDLARVFVNGEWIGCCRKAHVLVDRYRSLRREGRIVDPFTTIYWDPILDEVEFWLDVGRLRRPLLIVDNNLAEYDAARVAPGATGGAPDAASAGLRGLVMAQADNEMPTGMYFAATDVYVHLTPAWHSAINEIRVSAATGEFSSTDRLRAEDPSSYGGPGGDARLAKDWPLLDQARRRAYAEARLALYQTADGPSRLVANGFGEVAPAPSEARDFVLLAAPRVGGVQSAAPVEFTQNIRFTPEHVSAIREGRLTLQDLVREGIAEYITPEEQENCLIAESIDTLREHQHNVAMRFTHCDVEQAIFGITALVSPFGNHTQPARVTYETNQGRQTCGWYVLNFPYRTDKNRFFQFYNEVPLIRTITHKLVPSNGMNAHVLYACYGDNQEDSAIVCQDSSDRGFFAGAFFRYELVELEKGEMFCNPDALTTKNLKQGASYEKLVDGFIRRGSVVRFGDVLVGRVAKLTRRAAASPDDKYQFTDRSVLYQLQEPALVEDVLQLRGANDELFCIVKLRYERPLRTGDKMSSRSGNKSIVAQMIPQCDMPFTESGLTPDIIINPHSFPSRMTIGQLIETTLGKINSYMGVISDGTPFIPVDHLAFFADLVRCGYRFNGRDRMYEGTTGVFFDAAMFIGPIMEQRLQKFVLDDEQAVGGSSPTDATTGQPLGGKHVHGGIRIGEMERWCLQCHGTILNLYEKTHTDSDGRTMYVCRGCGNLAVYNEYQKIYQCRTCNEMADISAVDSTKTAILFHEELAASGIRMRLGLRPREFEEKPAPAPATVPPSQK